MINLKSSLLHQLVMSFWAPRVSYFQILISVMSIEPLTYILSNIATVPSQGPLKTLAWKTTLTSSLLCWLLVLLILWPIPKLVFKRTTQKNITPSF